MCIDVKSLMRVTVADRTGTFVVLGINAMFSIATVLDEKDNGIITVKLDDVTSVVDDDVRVPKVPTSVVVEHLKDVHFNPEEEDVYATVCDAMVMNSRIKDFFQTMVDAIDFDAAINQVQATDN